MATAGKTAARPQLTPDQKQLTLAAADELVCATVMGRPAAVADPSLGGAADHPVCGTFVSLKRAGRLRSCCGSLGQPVALRQSLEDAAIRTARDDARFPPVSPTELEHLEMEVWLLYAPEPVPARGEERSDAVTVGKHGVQVIRGQARGLLLPGVAVENKWDAREFLDQVCIKAGLHPSLWKDEATSLFTFEGEAIQGRLAAFRSGNGLAHQPASFSSEHLAAYADFCRSNIVTLLRGATPSFYLFGTPDGNVNGVIVTVQGKAVPDGWHFSQLSMRPGLPLQSTLYRLAQSAAGSLARRGIRADELEGLQVGLTLLYDPAMHGTVAEPDLAGIDPGQRTVVVFERTRSGWMHDPQRTPEDLVQGASEQARVDNPSAAQVISLGAVSTVDRVAISTAPQPVRGPEVRPPGLPGAFYPADPSELAKLVDDLLPEKSRSRPCPAAMVPHAGLKYSGRLAAEVLSRIKIPSTVIVLGPKHTTLGMEWSVAPQQTWSMPGFSVESVPTLARKLAQTISGLELDAAAHAREHATEVELPLIARLAPKARVVGIAIGSGDLESCRRFAEGLASVLGGRKERPLLLISSDMNHFATDAETRRLDEMALAALEQLDPAGVYEAVTKNRISMCGVLPAVIVLETLRLLGGVRKAERVGYSTTADVTGDTSRVVGYAGMLFR